MDKKSKTKIVKFSFFVGILIIFIVGIGVILRPQTEVVKYSNLDGFAKCIRDSGAKFYGTFWCSYCNKQKQMFGSAEQYLPYVECSSADSRSQLEICTKEGIEGFPTWKFADGSSASGLLELDVLAEKTKCTLPVNP